MVPICKTCSNRLSFFKNKKVAELGGGGCQRSAGGVGGAPGAAKAALSAQSEEMDRTVKGLEL